jgi:cysteine desulfurase/selenocysteine lyase
MAFDAERVRADFPILAQARNGQPLAYLDNAATTQKPRRVLETLQQYYAEENANIHRGVYRLSAAATLAYERVRATVQRFLNARDPHEIIFVRGTTEAINLVAQSFGRPRLEAGDEILLSTMEHHSNIVPWQLVAEAAGARVRVIPMTDTGELDLGTLDELLTVRTRLVGVVHVSNSLGSVNPVAEIVRRAHERGIPVLVDGAQAVPHFRVDVRALDCDFYAFSGHKTFGPTGIGVLYGKASHLQAMPPYQGGGEMIDRVTFEGTTFAPPPARFEAGTPNIAGVIGLSTRPPLG